MIEAKKYQCFKCNKIEAWNENWSWYGSWQEMDEGKEVITFCRQACQITFTEKEKIEHISKEDLLIEQEIEDYEAVLGEAQIQISDARKQIARLKKKLSMERLKTTI